MLGGNGGFKVIITMVFTNRIDWDKENPLTKDQLDYINICFRELEYSLKVNNIRMEHKK